MSQSIHTSVKPSYRTIRAEGTLLAVCAWGMVSKTDSQLNQPFSAPGTKGQ